MITLSFTSQEKRPQQKRSMHFFSCFWFSDFNRSVWQIACADDLLPYSKKKSFQHISFSKILCIFSGVFTSTVTSKRQQHINVQKNILLLGGALNKFSQQILLISLHLWIQTSVKLFENANVCIKCNSNDKNLVNKIRTKCARNRSTDVVGLKKLLFTKSGAWEAGDI